jgi:hypothetical protein
VSRSAKIAILVSAVVLVCLAGTCVGVLAFGPGLPTLFGCRDAATPAVGPLRDTPDRVRQMYPKLEGVTAAHWQVREAVPRTCPDIGPMDYRTNGFVVLSADRVASYRAAFTWSPADAPDVPADLRPFAPASPRWEASDAFDREIAGDNSTFVLDPSTGTLYFTHQTG